MSSAKQRKQKESNPATSKAKIQKYFPHQPASIPGSDSLKMASGKGSPRAATPHEAVSPTSAALGSASSARTAEGKQAPHRTEYVCFGEPVDLGEIIKSLPSREDIQQMIHRLEESHGRELQDIREDVQKLTTRQDSVEGSNEQLGARLQRTEARLQEQETRIIHLQLALEESEDRSRRENLRLRGIPERIDQNMLPKVVANLFQELAPLPPGKTYHFDRIHRALGPRSSDPARPRDVLCKLHKYSLKEAVARAAWDAGIINKDDYQIQILSDVSRPTLQRRAVLKPLLASLKNAGLHYKWGFPFHVIFTKDDRSFVLRDPDDLPALFEFAGIAAMEVPNWLTTPPRAGWRPAGVPLPRREAGRPYPARDRRRRRNNAAQEEVEPEN